MSEFDLAAYLNRIGNPPTSPLNRPTLSAIHRGHLHNIPFENLEIQMGGSIALDAEALQGKMVRRRRGGYCFEQNNLLLLALRAIGFEAGGREARVRQNSGGTVRPRTHMVLIVRCDDREWLADVGFGGDGLLEPVRTGRRRGPAGRHILSCGHRRRRPRAAAPARCYLRGSVRHRTRSSGPGSISRSGTGSRARILEARSFCTSRRSA